MVDDGPAGHQGCSSPFHFRNFPVLASDAFAITDVMPAALSSGVISAFGPPMSVFTKPGWTSRTVVPSRFSASTALSSPC